VQRRLEGNTPRLEAVLRKNKLPTCLRIVLIVRRCKPTAIPSKGPTSKKPREPAGQEIQIHASLPLLASGNWEITTTNSQDNTSEYRKSIHLRFYFIIIVVQTDKRQQKQPADAYNGN